jgi:hypothetical protein
MLIFLSWIIGVIATLCAVPLLLVLGGFSIFTLVISMIEMDSTLVIGGLVGLLWTWAGFLRLIWLFELDVYTKSRARRKRY